MKTHLRIVPLWHRLCRCSTLSCRATEAPSQVSQLVIDETPALGKTSLVSLFNVLLCTHRRSSLRTRNKRGFSGSQTATQSSGTPFSLSHFANRDYNICLVLGFWKRISSISVMLSNIKASESEWKHCTQKQVETEAELVLQTKVHSSKYGITSLVTFSRAL